MKKIILTAVMVLTLLYVGLIDFSYAKDLSKGIPELTEGEKDYEKVEKDYENLPISIEERKIEQNADESYEKDREDDVVEDVDDEVGVE
jgi:uncharacterized protein YxeA